ncbi:hypothetical protein FRB94_009122 [Tulasnella sp. JGI-2019a]|nr:hypothetical protein FRB94_009122 [Tulasnella sp. JGI-2019a]KAG8999059.1 hypothetical protein FRB93_013329 [Tulasnella sp. JGI-2019a]KAG9030778.1 hypothetical protein FRB95_003537 [Tulasnella sp. JGI-2019a]
MLSTLTRQQFISASKDLLEKRNPLSGGEEGDLTSSLYQGWVWREHSAYNHLGYLERLITLADEPSNDATDAISEDEVTETLDISEAPSSLTVHRLIMQQYVVWSSSFQVPVFYFTMHDSGGAPVSLRRMYNTSFFRKSRHLAKLPEDLTSALFPAASTNDIDHEAPTPFPLLTQGDHPILGTPCWYLHPCESPAAVQEIMKEIIRDGLTASDEHLMYLKTWFMVLSGIVDLRYDQG